ncbi:MAG: hypothetical protein K2R98_05910 [Gemmataceae bacterium]|nr:hypothetical protein [Gemmataceae bacterium]
MKFFTPELLARCRSLDDDVAEAASQEWDQARAAYRLRFKAIRASLPVGARRLFARASLHDAKVIGVSFGKRKANFSLLLRLEGASSQPGELLELNYHPVGGPTGGISFRRHPQVAQGAPEALWVLYDEFDLKEELNFFTHSILMTGGYELQVRFHSLRCRNVGEIVSPLQLSEEERTWPLASRKTSIF